MAPPQDRLWLVSDDVNELGSAEAERQLRQQNDRLSAEAGQIRALARQIGKAIARRADRLLAGTSKITNSYAQVVNRLSPELPRPCR